MMKIQLVSALLYVFLILPCKGQNKDFRNIKIEKIDSYLSSANKAYRFNGTALIYHKGKILLNKGYGFRNFSTKQKNTPKTRFPILSITKTITAAIILKLHDEGRLSLNDNLRSYFPDYPNGSKIKISHLLNHTSGIYNYTVDVGEEDSLIVNYPIPKTFVLDHFKNKPLDFEPGQYYSYNNSAYFLLGLIIEKIVGKPYEAVVRDIVFNPLEMHDSGFDFINLPNSARAQGYQFWTKDHIKPYKHYDSTFAYSAGSIYSTSTDLFRWAKAVSEQKILKRKTWKQAFTPNLNNYGYGWEIGVFSGKNYIKHSGGYPGFMSELIYYPKEDAIIVLLNNFGNYNQNVWSIGMGVSSILFNLPYDNWKLRKEIHADDSILNEYSGIYKLNGKKSIDITLKDNTLFLNNGYGEQKLHAESETVFYLENFNTQITFGYKSMLLHEHGQTTNWVKIN
ncbi:serine hydrolase domain-containing protein [Winogradskyella sp.]|uniref:serine hydrolase domain-containing protein n=1 Tax=Winogradskyella sp. TaxID=1883156 RepID=UPI003BABA526